MKCDEYPGNWYHSHASIYATLGHVHKTLDEMETDRVFDIDPDHYILTDTEPHFQSIWDIQKSESTIERYHDQKSHLLEHVRKAELKG